MPPVPPTGPGGAAELAEWVLRPGGRRRSRGNSFCRVEENERAGLYQHIHSSPAATCLPFYPHLNRHPHPSRLSSLLPLSSFFPFPQAFIPSHLPFLLFSVYFIPSLLLFPSLLLVFLPFIPFPSLFSSYLRFSPSVSFPPSELPVPSSPNSARDYFVQIIQGDFGALGMSASAGLPACRRSSAAATLPRSLRPRPLPRPALSLSRRPHLLRPKDSSHP